MVSIIVVAFNRREILARTLRELAAQGLPGDGSQNTIAANRFASEVIVVDNASGDGTAAMVKEQFPQVRVLALPKNMGVTAFNLGVREAQGDLILTLDDDSWPAKGSLVDAIAYIRANSNTAGVALLPTNPQSGKVEWRFARKKKPRTRWPVMGCGNLVRAEAWRKVGGYEELFFLYRNDTDLALKLLAAGYDVYFNPQWVVWHDSPAASVKGDRWLHYATRNWIWMCKRHGRGAVGVFAQWAGVLWACKAAGFDGERLKIVFQGVREARRGHVPQMPTVVTPDGEALKELVKLQFGARVAGL